ncbi:MAG: DUF4198 domain-containing protein [Symploca sp. SIO2B6]|nr:DUF4198 domain-containing protein [Symploca sp. SIO2B6]
MSLKSSLLTALIACTVAPLSAMAIARPAAAHNVETDYILSDPSQLDIQVLFSNGDPFEDAPVQIYSPDNFETPILEGTTDAEGRFSFNPETIPMEQDVDFGEWKMKIGELGHGDILMVPVDEEGIDIDLVGDNRPANHLSNRQTNHQASYWAAGVAIISLALIARRTASQDIVDSHQ